MTVTVNAVTPLAGDANVDGIVDLGDVVRAVQHWGASGEEAIWAAGPATEDTTAGAATPSIDKDVLDVLSLPNPQGFVTTVRQLNISLGT